MMNFPVIKNITDIIPAVQDRAEFIISEKEGYVVVNYNVMFEDTFLNPEEAGITEQESLYRSLRREARGIIFDTKKGNIIRRPFHKFFNVSEREETQVNVIDLSRPHAILEKLDGSMCSVFAHEGKLIWGTKMVAQDFHEMIEQFVKSSDINYEDFCWELINSGHTPIFEWMHPQKRIVIDYGKEPTLTLTAIREIESGRYLSQDAMHDLALGYNIPVVRAFDPQTDMKAFIEYVRGLEDLEGFVVRFDDGHMIKLKCDWYVQIHKAKEAILQDRNIVALILDEKLDDIKAHLPAEDRDRLSQFESQINSRILDRSGHLSDATKREQSMGDRKFFALNRAQEYNSYSKSIVFALWDDNSYERSSELVRRTIRNNIGRNTKWEELRDHWFDGVVFNG
jgi:RNA ligase